MTTLHVRSIVQMSVAYLLKEEHVIEIFEPQNTVHHSAPLSWLSKLLVSRLTWKIKNSGEV